MHTLNPQLSNSNPADTHAIFTTCQHCSNWNIMILLTINRCINSHHHLKLHITISQTVTPTHRVWLLCQTLWIICTVILSKWIQRSKSHAVSHHRGRWSCWFKARWSPCFFNKWIIINVQALIPHNLFFFFFKGSTGMTENSNRLGTWKSQNTCRSVSVVITAH